MLNKNEQSQIGDIGVSVPVTAYLPLDLAIWIHGKQNELGLARSTTIVHLLQSLRAQEA